MLTKKTNKMSIVSGLYAALTCMALLFIFPFSTFAATSVTCPLENFDRQVTVTMAETCVTIEGNAKLSDIEAVFGDIGWENAGKIDKDTTLNEDYLTLAFTSGGFGLANATGTWTIDPTFWVNYESAVLSIHVGGGNVTPDSFMYGLTSGALSGTFDVSCVPTSNKCGFSNMNLWGVPTTVVPIPAAAWLFGSALLGLGAVKRKKS